MNLQKKVTPNIFIYTPDRQKSVGVVNTPLEFCADYNFGTLSQLTFKVQKYIYNADSYKWIKNSYYENLTKHMLLFTTDDGDKIVAKGNSVYDERGEEIKYSSKNHQQSSSRDTTHSSLSFTPEIYGVDDSKVIMQNETLLYDVGSFQGYEWKYCCAFKEDGKEVTEGSKGGYYYDHLICETFFPVKVGDIISMGSKVGEDNHFSSSGNVNFQYKLFFYSDNDEKKLIKTIGFSTYDPVGRVRVIHEYINGDAGFVRFELICNKAKQETISQSWSSTEPGGNYIHIYSGEKRCQEIEIKKSYTHHFPIQWWTIVDIEEEDMFFNSCKTITAYSYEATLAYKPFSLSESTLPLYIPDTLVNHINSNDFVYDACKSGETITEYSGSQTIQRGLLNQILDYLPQWKIGLISAELLTRYRSIPKVDNSNVYAFLSDTVQSLYNCFIVFDSNERTINVMSYKDFRRLSSPIMLSWQNALKSLKTNLIDDSAVTAISVNTADNTYGLGLINPTGNNIIYNFSNIKKYLNYVADDKHYKSENSKDVYTLRDVVDKYEMYLKKALNGEKIEDLGLAAYNSSYRQAAKELVDSILRYQQLKSKLSESKAEYVSTAEQINILLKTCGITNIEDYYISTSVVRTPYSMKEGSYSPQYGTADPYIGYYSEDMYLKLLSNATTYNKVLLQISELDTRIRDKKKMLKYYALIFSTNYRTLKTEYEKCQRDGTPYNPIFTPKEAAALSNYIICGIWSNENAIFSDKYSADDIIDTLVETYDNANQELKDMYSKPIYEFEADIVNIFKNEEMSKVLKKSYIGSTALLINHDDYISPVLMTVHIDYNDTSQTNIVLSNNYKYRSMNTRFCDMFKTINQVSVVSPEFSFDT